RRDLAYWRDVGLGALGAISILGCLGHFLDWIKDRRSIDSKIGLGFLLAYGLLAAIAPNRFNFVIYSLVAIVALGVLGAIASQSLLGLPIVLPCALLTYALLRWKGHLLK